MEPEYAKVSWTPADIQYAFPGMSYEDAVMWLETNGSHLQDRLIELGWTVIESIGRS